MIGDLLNVNEGKNSFVYQFIIQGIFLIYTIAFLILKESELLVFTSIFFAISIFSFIVIGRLLSNIVLSEDMVSIIFLFFTGGLYLLLGGFHVNSAMAVLGMAVPISIVGLHDVRELKTKIRVILYYCLGSSPLLFAYLFPEQVKQFSSRFSYGGFLISDTLHTLNISLFVLVLFLLLFFTVMTNNKLYHKLVSLIYDALPTQMAEKIITNKEPVSYEYYPDAMLLIADIVSFTEMSENVSAEKLVEFLNELFYKFDLLVEEMGLEKLKTIGDAYLVGARIHSNAKPEKLIELAKKMLEIKKNIFLLHDEPVKLRISIHKGSFYGGILGEKYFYDIWGNEIFFADELGTYGEPEQIILSQEMKDELSETPYKLKKIKIDRKKESDIVGYVLEYE